MKYVFWGSPEFAKIVLEKLIEAGFLPAAVVCNPDRPVGRKKVITPPPVKRLIAERKAPIEIFQPENLNAISDKLSALRSDFFIVAAYSKILPKEIIAVPRLGTVGVHPSLLPKYRGATPIQSAIINGEMETGVTLFMIDEKVDHGPVATQRKLQIANRNYTELEKGLAEIAGDLLVETLPKLEQGQIKPQPQDETKATFTKKFRTEDGEVNLEKDSPEMILRKIRAFNPEPGAYNIQNGKRVKLLEAELADGKLKLKKIQVEGKNPVTK